ncbi:MAG: hypothetical protein JHD16_07505, partial [Solirubrobacteraceae bacterium]|nr:hypothetical protein [Solirubrobacteraceae bacterium]
MEPHTIPQAEGPFHDLTVAEPGHTGAHAGAPSAGGAVSGVHVPSPADPYAAAATPAAQSTVTPTDPYAGYADPVAAHAAAQAQYEAELAAYEAHIAAQAAAEAEAARAARAEAPAPETAAPAPLAEGTFDVVGEASAEPEIPEHDASVGEDGELLLEGLSRPAGLARHTRSDLDAAVSIGLLTTEQVAAARATGAEQGRLPEAILLEQGAISPEGLARATSERHGIELIDLSLFKVDFAAANLIDPAAAKRYEALPVKMLTERVVMVAMVDPANIIVIDD